MSSLFARAKATAAAASASLSKSTGGGAANEPDEAGSAAAGAAEEPPTGEAEEIPTDKAMDGFDKAAARSNWEKGMGAIRPLLVIACGDETADVMVKVLTETMVENPAQFAAAMGGLPSPAPSKFMALFAAWKHMLLVHRQEAFDQDPVITPILQEAFHWARYAQAVYGGTKLFKAGLDDKCPPGAGLTMEVGLAGGLTEEEMQPPPKNFVPTPGKEKKRFKVSNERTFCAFFNITPAEILVNATVEWDARSVPTSLTHP